MLLDYWRHETAFRYPEDLIKSLGPVNDCHFKLQPKFTVMPFKLVRYDCPVIHCSSIYAVYNFYTVFMVTG